MEKIDVINPQRGKSELISVLLSKSWSVVLALVFFLTACDKEPDAPNEFPFDPGVLTASKTAVVVDAANPGSEAITLNLVAEKNSMIRYSVIFETNAKADTSVSFAANTITKSLTMGELNKILVDTLDLMPYVSADIKISVLATIPLKGSSVVTNALTLKVTPGPAGPAYSALWIVGSATPNGWNIDNPNKMVRDAADPYIFRYNEVLNAGEFKIPTSTGNWGTDFFMPAVANAPITSTIVKLVTGGNPDNKWVIPTTGAYKITLNININPSIQIKPFTPYTQLWMVGDATPAGWNINNPTPLVKNVGNPYEFTYTGSLNAGEFKIPTSTGDWGTDFFMPPTNHPAITTTQTVLIPKGNPDNKWQITQAGNYKITFNQLKETIKIEKL